MTVLLGDVTDSEQLALYYAEKGLISNSDKIEHLTRETGVIAIRGACVDDEDDMLDSLEHSVYRGHWRYLSAKR